MPVISAERMQGRIDAIVEAASAVFAAKGYEAASIAEIARRAEVSDGLIYRYFSNKRDLLYRVLEAFYERVVAALEKEVAKDAGFEERLHALVRRHLGNFVADRELCRLFLSEVRVASDYKGSTIQTLNRRYASVLTGLIEAGIAAGEVKTDASARLIRDVIFGAIEHIAWPYVNGDGKLDVEATAQSVTALICGGICLPQQKNPEEAPRT
ncbi:TetR/AcrR family transcriptional regulator [Zavarzinia compransoris]|uniref:TetR/AcrR family transcriptional regulator n=1 Tax=Zavarzinia marina TaxID=2911065 RepID=UPI001F4139BA|nr:TetR/AcrR family transcriptional regulator [Zavarzinia marina]MCF4165681.1 TetR/AcrR family transcriptional regulator [Zavarzinia marina]